MSVFDVYYRRLAAAFVRGRQLQGEKIGLPETLVGAELADLTDVDVEEILAQGAAAGLKLHKFKRTMELPRVHRVLGILRSLTPARLLDVGSGRGAFLWPLLDTFPDLEVWVVERDADRVRDVQAVHLGGISRVVGRPMDATCLELPDRSFEVVTMLEVLEHIAEPLAALHEVVRVAAGSVILSVPSQPDDNPQHIHLFDQTSLVRMLICAGAKRVNFEYVLGHMIAVVRIANA